MKNKKKLDNKKLMTKYLKELAKVFGVLLVFTLIIAYFSFRTIDDASISNSELKLTSNGGVEQNRLKGRYIVARTYFEDIYNIPNIFFKDDEVREFLDDGKNYNNLKEVFEMVPKYEEIKKFVENGKNIATGRQKLYFFRRFTKTAVAFAEYAIDHKKFEDAIKAYKAAESMVFFRSAGSIAPDPYLVEYILSLGMKGYILESVKKVEKQLNRPQKKQIVRILKRLRDKTKSINDAFNGEKEMIIRVMKVYRGKNPFKMGIIELFSNPLKNSEELYMDYYNDITKALEKGTDFKQIDKIVKKHRSTRNPFVKENIIYFEKLGETIDKNHDEYDELIMRLEK